MADFTENLPATPAGVGEGSKETLVDWVVSLPDAKLSEKLCIITFDAGGTTASGRCLKARAQNRLRIPGFVVTDHEALRLIMVHEFFDPDTLAFDPVRSSRSSTSSRCRSVNCSPSTTSGAARGASSSSSLCGPALTT